GPQELPGVRGGRREIDVAPPHPARARPAGADQLHGLRIVREDEVVTELERAEVLLGRLAEDVRVLARHAERLPVQRIVELLGHRAERLPAAHHVPPPPPARAHRARPRASGRSRSPPRRRAAGTRTGDRRRKRRPPWSAPARTRPGWPPDGGWGARRRPHP